MILAYILQNFINSLLTASQESHARGLDLFQSSFLPSQLGFSSTTKLLKLKTHAFSFYSLSLSRSSYGFDRAYYIFS